ncbi:hypothetical protein Q4I32_007954 [Leishmania shawi]|uniref:Uncharacterized protein n=1 Tax=Leishmania shawi TaxID=5680 RepID=A0AAW3B6P8_9TRYP
MSATLVERTGNDDGQSLLKRPRLTAIPDGSSMDRILPAAHVRSTMKLRRRNSRLASATVSEGLGPNTESNAMPTSPLLSPLFPALSTFDPSSTRSSMHSTSLAQSRGDLAAGTTHITLSKEPRCQCSPTKTSVLSLIIKPASCLAMVRVSTALHPDASSVLPQCERKSSTSRELCSFTDDQRTNAKTAISDKAREQKPLRVSGYSKKNICQLRIKPVRNFAVCRALEIGGCVLAEEVQRYNQRPLLPAAALYPTAIKQRSSALTVNTGDARKEERRRGHEYTKAHIMSLRWKPLKGYAMYRVT